MNFKLLLITTLIVVLTACGGAEERKAVYMEKAKSSIEAGDLDKARIELKNVLQIDPKDSEAYYQLGKVHEQQKDYTKAYRNYLKAEELDPDNLINQAKLGTIYLLLANDKEKAQEKIDFILAKDPEHPEGLLLKATMMLKNKNADEALNITESVVNKNPGNIDGVVMLATLYINKNQTKKAIGALDNALKVRPGNEKLNNSLALTLVKNKEFDRAEVIYKKFLEDNPDSVASYRNLAAFYNQTGDKDKAVEVLRASVENDPDDVDRQLTLVKYIKAIKGSDDAIKELEGLIANNSGIGKLRVALGELLYISGDKQGAITVYEKAVNDFPGEGTSVEARISLASIYINDKDYKAASNVVNEAISISPNDPKVNMLKARLAVNEKDLEQAIIALRVVTKETPENIEAFILLANVYQLEGNSDQVRNTLNSAYDNNKTNPDALIILAKYHLSRDIALAEKIIDDYNSIKESDYEGLTIKAAILNQKKEYAEAYKLANITMEKYSDKPSGYLQSIPYFSQQGDKQNAISILEKGYLNVKENRKILVLLSTLQVSEKQYDIVEKRIQAELVSSPDDVQLNILLAKVYLDGGNNDSAEKILKKVIVSSPSLEEAYLLLSRIYQANQDLVSVKSILLEGKVNVASSLKIPLRLAVIYEIEGEYQKAIDVYRELNSLQPDNLVIVNNLASMLSDHGNDDDLNQAKSLVGMLKDSDQPVFLDTVGWVYYKLGDYQSAIEYLTRSVEKMPDVNIFSFHLGMAHKMNGDKDQAKTYLEKSLAGDKPFKQRELAQAALKEI